MTADEPAGAAAAGPQAGLPLWGGVVIGVIAAVVLDGVIVGLITLITMALGAVDGLPLNVSDVASAALLGSIFGIGLVQLIWLIPAIVIAALLGRRGIALGLIIGAAIVFLLNAACFGIVFGGIAVLSGASFSP